MTSQRHKFFGLRNSRSQMLGKYADCEYIRSSSCVVRKLSPAEIDEFRVHVQRRLDPKSGTGLVPRRRAIV